MKLTAAALLVFVVSTACTPAEEAVTVPPPDSTAAPVTEPPAPTYPAFTAVDPHTHRYFIALEGTGLAEGQGEERLWGLGMGVCRNLDDGGSVAGEVEGLAVDAGLGDAAGSVVASAVSGICEQHLPAVEAWVAGES